MADLKVQGEVSLDASGVETGVTKAKRSLAGLGEGARQASDKMTQANARTSASIDRFIAKTEQAAKNVGKTATEIKLYELAQKGATQAQLQAAEAALKQVDAMKQQEERAERMKGRIAAIAVLASGALIGAGVAYAAKLKTAVDSIDSFNDLADATGASVENISALDRVARENGGTFEQVSSILTKFNGVLNKTDEDSDKAAEVFKKLGLDAKALKEIDPAEALRQTAVALAGFADDGNKARAVQLLFGKSVAEVAPLLKDLSEQSKLVGTVSTQAAKEAEAFNKALFGFKANSEDTARSLVSDFLPALNRVLSTYMELKRVGALTPGGVLGALKVGIGVGSPGADIQSLMADRERIQKEQAGASPNGPRGRGFSANARVRNFQQELEDNFRALEGARAAQRVLALDGLGDTGDAISRRLNPRVGSIGSIPDGKKGGGGGAPKDPLAEAKRYLASLEDRLQKTRELTNVEAVLADIERGKFVVNDAIKEKMVLTAKQLDTKTAEKKLEEDLIKTREKTAAMQKAADEAAQRSVEQSIASNEALREEIETIGLEASELRKLEQVRLANIIAAKELALIGEQSIEGNEDRVRLLEQEVVLLKQQKELRGQRNEKLEAVEREKESKEFAKGVNDDLKKAFQDAFSAGTKNPIKAFGESLYATVTSRISAALAESLATKVLESIGMGAATTGSNKSSSGPDWGGILTSLAGRWFGAGGTGMPDDVPTRGGRAMGGPVTAGGMYRVNERGPEMLTVAGKDFLMMGSQAGKVTPNEKLGGTTITVSNNFTVSGPTDRRSQEQVAAAAGTGVRRAVSRNR